MWIWVHYKMFRIIHGICWPKQNIQTYRKQFSCRMGGSRSPLCWWQAPCSQCWLQPYLSLLLITAHSRLQHFAPKIYLRLLKPIPYTTTSKKSTCRTIPTLSSWFKCLGSKQQKQQLVLERNKGTDIHTALHAVANCALSNEQTTFSDSLISEHADPYHAHKSNNESMSNSKIKMNYDLNAEETRMFAPFGETCCIKNASPFLKIATEFSPVPESWWWSMTAVWGHM